MGQDLTKEKVLAQETYSSSVENKLLNSIKNNYQLFSGTFLNNSKIDSNINHPYSLVVSTKPYYLNNVADPILEPTTNPAHIAILKSHHNLNLYKELDTEFRIYASEQNDFLNGTVFTNEEKYVYDVQNPDKLTSKKVKNSNGDFLETKYLYPDDLVAEPLMADLKAVNRISTPIVTEQYKAGILLSKNKTIYAKDGSTSNLLLPKSIYQAKFPNILPSIPGIGNLEKKITYDSYDSKGNILQYTPESGTPVCIIWGYNQSQPIAKIENSTYSSIDPSLITAAQTASDTGTEASLLTALEALRINLPNALVTTFTHIPLIGVSTITDPKKDKISYTYDSFGRLQNVKDKNGNILSENEYHYKN